MISTLFIRQNSYPTVSIIVRWVTIASQSSPETGLFITIHRDKSSKNPIFKNIFSVYAHHGISCDYRKQEINHQPLSIFTDRKMNLNTLIKLKQYPNIGLILLAFAAFIALGMPDGLLGVAWPSIRGSFGLPLDAVGFLIIAGTTGYMTSSFVNGPLIARFGVGRILAASCALTSTGLVRLYPGPRNGG
jgi:fucose permease